MMNERIREQLEDYCMKFCIPYDENDLLYFLREMPKVWKGNYQGMRWWIEWEQVVDVAGMYLRFVNAESFCDETPEDKGWMFDIDGVVEVEPYEVKATEYREIGDK